MKSHLSAEILGRIWNLSDIDKDRRLDSHEFAVAMQLINGVRQGQTVPTKLPSVLLPPSKGPTFTPLTQTGVVYSNIPLGGAGGTDAAFNSPRSMGSFDDAQGQQNKINMYQMELRGYERQMENIEANKESIHGHMQTYQARIEDLERQKTEYEQLLKEQQTQYAEEEESLKRLQTELQDTESEIENLKKHIQKTKEDLEVLRKETTNLRDEIDKNRRLYDERKEQLRQHESEAQRLRQKLVSLQEEKGKQAIAMKVQTQELDNTKVELAKQKKSLDDKIQALGGNLQLNDLILQAEKDLDNVRNEYSKLKNQKNTRC